MPRLRVTKMSLLITGMTGLVVATAQASAQSVGVYIGPSGYTNYGNGYGYYGYGDGYRYRYGDRYRTGDGVRVYGYSRRASGPDDSHSRHLRRSSAGCGTYYFWNGDGCVDARDR